jgi:hypothetical protein
MILRSKNGKAETIFKILPDFCPVMCANGGYRHEEIVFRMPYLPTCNQDSFRLVEVAVTLPTVFWNRPPTCQNCTSSHRVSNSLKHANHRCRELRHFAKLNMWLPRYRFAKLPRLLWCATRCLCDTLWCFYVTTSCTNELRLFNSLNSVRDAVIPAI